MSTSPFADLDLAPTGPPSHQYLVRLVVGIVIAGVVATVRVESNGDVAIEPQSEAVFAGPGRVFLPIAVRDRSLAGAPRTTWDHAFTGPMNDVAWDALRGWVWAGGQDGLWAWDAATGAALHFKQADGMAADMVTSLAVTADGVVWVGHGSAGNLLGSAVGASRRAVDGTWSVITGQGRGLPNATVLCAAVAPDGRVWLGTVNGAARLEPDGFWTTLRLPDTTSPGFGWHSITAIAFDRDGNAWLGTAKGLLRVSVLGVWRMFAEGGRPTLIDAVAVDPDGFAWVARGSNGLTRIAPEASVTGNDGRTRLTEADGLPNRDVADVDIDPEGRLWVAWYDGIGVRQPDGSWSRWTLRSELGGLPLPSANVRALDASGDAPAAAAWGMALLRDGSRGEGERWRAFEPDVRIGASHASIGMLTLPDGRIAAAIYALYGAPGGLAVRAASGDWRLHRLSDVTPGGVTTRDAGPVDMVPTDPESTRWDGGLWLVGNGGLYRWRSEGAGRLERGAMPPGEACAYPDSLAAPSSGSLWLACGTGDGQQAPSLWRRGPRADDGWTAVALPESREVWDLAVGPDGTVWAATYDIAYRMTPEGWARAATTRGPDDRPIHRIDFDRDGAAWLLEGYRGVVVQPRIGSARSITGLSSGWVRTLAPDPDGGMWIGTDKGFGYVDPDGGVTNGTVPAPPSTPDGTVTNWNQVWSVTIGHRGDLWLGTPQGIARWR